MENQESKKSFGYEKTAIYMFIMSLAASGFNYLFQIASGRLLDASAYGVLNASFSVVGIVTVAGVALGMSLAKNISQDASNIGGIIKRLFRLGIVVALPFILAVFAVMLVMGYELITSVLTAVTTYTISLSYLFYGSLQGKQLFWQVSIFNLIVPLSKMLFGTALLFAGAGINSVLCAMIAGSFISMVYGYLVLVKRADFSAHASKEECARIIKYMFFTLLSASALTLFNNVDVLLIRQYFSAKELGLYSCAALFGKIILYIPTVLVTMMFPIAAKNDGKSKTTLYKTLLYSFLISSVAAAALYVLRRPVISIVMGQSYLPSADYILSVILFVIPLVMVTVVTNYLIATNDKWFASAACFSAALLMLVLTYFFHISIPAMLGIIAVIYFVLFVVLLIRGILKK